MTYDSSYLRFLAHGLRYFAEPVGPQHAYWDLITDLELAAKENNAIVTIVQAVEISVGILTFELNKLACTE